MSELRNVRGIEMPSFPLVERITFKPLLGARLNVNVVTLEGGAESPVHSHEEEQLGYIVKGACEFTDGSSTWVLEPGDCYHAEPHVPHGARALGEGCVIIDAFAPPRAGVADLLRAQP
ncbi:MAG: cupin domain-containing protein [Actinomycetota bacterium]